MMIGQKKIITTNKNNLNNREILESGETNILGREIDLKKMRTKNLERLQKF